MREIPLTQGKVALVDDEDYESLAAFKWHVRHSYGSVYYAVRNHRISKGQPQSTLSMHRVLLGLTDSATYVDHVDGNGLNNQRSNLRIATHSQNHQNVTITALNTSGFKGVYRKRKRWQALIGFQGQQVYLGLFRDKVDAALAYDAAAYKYFGEFACVNFPQKGRAAR